VINLLYKTIEIVEGNLLDTYLEERNSIFKFYKVIHCFPKHNVNVRYILRYFIHNTFSSNIYKVVRIFYVQEMRLTRTVYHTRIEILANISEPQIHHFNNKNQS